MERWSQPHGNRVVGLQGSLTTVRSSLNMLLTTLFLKGITAKENHDFFLVFLLVSVILKILFMGREKTHLIYIKSSIFC